LLPGVAVEHGLDAEQFLEHVCLKAELPPTAWLDDQTQLWTFEGHAIRAPLGDFLPADARPPRALPVEPHELPALAEYCRGNLVALVEGATPSYFAFGLPDGNVHGLVVSVLDQSGNELLQANRISLRNSLPLQSTLFSLTESLAGAVRRMGLGGPQLRSVRVALTLFAEPALHGPASDPDLRGLDPRRHLVLVSERQRSAALYHPAHGEEQLVRAAAAAAQLTMPEAAQVLTFECLTAQAPVQVVNVPRPSAGADVRPAGVAGRFYPGEADELARLVNDCFRGVDVRQEAWPAVMVPHAGLIYSGRIAAQTLARVKFPSTMLIIGPKHTPYGVEWAVAPHAAWSIPGATIASDPELARRLAAAIPGLQLDAAAHAQEHAIEVELPLLARLAPRSKVVGMAIGGGDLARCRQFATGLAGVIRQLPEPPLLVISSDMNHFAADAENRRLDEIALQALETLDPEALYTTVTRQRISMCGVLPAVIVMETLRQLGRLKTSQRVAYATSADVSGDTSRVVGYAGMLLGERAG
jgi:AmmeMemoRadiSam system protein B